MGKKHYRGEDAVKVAIAKLKQNPNMPREANTPIGNYVKFISTSLRIDEFRVKQIITFLKNTGFIDWVNLK